LMPPTSSGTHLPPLRYSANMLPPPVHSQFWTSFVFHSCYNNQFLPCNQSLTNILLLPNKLVLPHILITSPFLDQLPTPPPLLTEIATISRRTNNQFYERQQCYMRHVPRNAQVISLYIHYSEFYSSSARFRAEGNHHVHPLHSRRE
jgi:hypothetical protein